MRAMTRYRSSSKAVGFKVFGARSRGSDGSGHAPEGSLNPSSGPARDLPGWRDKPAMECPSRAIRFAAPAACATGRQACRLRGSPRGLADRSCPHRHRAELIHPMLDARDGVDQRGAARVCVQLQPGQCGAGQQPVSRLQMALAQVASSTTDTGRLVTPMDSSPKRCKSRVYLASVLAEMPGGDGPVTESIRSKKTGLRPPEVSAKPLNSWTITLSCLDGSGSRCT